MIVVTIALWTFALAAVAAGIIAALLAIRLRRPALALFAVIPVGGGLLAAAFRVEVLPEPHAFGVVLALGVAALGVLGGNPLTGYVLDRATRDSVRRGAHGGILIRHEGNDTELEVLRGGTTIGYLERAAIVGAIAVGHPEVIAALIAVKGLGRFSELDSAAARERFIIGTLTSMIWASACAVLVAVLAGA